MLCLQDNLIRGRFLAELTREVFTDLEASKYQHAEMRISIYGRKQVRATAPQLAAAAETGASCIVWFELLDVSIDMPPYLLQWVEACRCSGC
jgi:hypothetical protein